MIKVMKKLFLVVFIVTAICLFADDPLKKDFVAVAETSDITLSTNVQTSLSLNLGSGAYPFGNLTAGTPKFGSAGITASVTTNASNGYTLGISDGVSGSDSALLHTDATTRIADAVATIASPAAWVSGTTKGLGVTVFAADTTKEAKWGTGTTYNDPNNKYAGVPETTATIHTSAAYKTGVDTTDLAFVVDVQADQKAGAYSGNATITATAVLI